ncbi:MAG: GerW family sporulation protein [Acidimicrobiales bacterium]|jgi:uncharacterized spore protein YtfJ
MSTKELLSRAAENVSVRRAFGAAYERDGLLVIPVALVWGGGGGGGTMPSPPSASPAAAAEVSDSAAEGSDEELPARSGAGFGGLIMPVGVYAVNGDQVRWIPVIDVTVVVLAGLSAVRLLVGLRSSRRRHHG